MVHGSRQYRIHPQVLALEVKAGYVGIFHPLSLNVTYIRVKSAAPLLALAGSSSTITGGRIQYFLSAAGTIASIQDLLARRILVSPAYRYKDKISSLASQIRTSAPVLLNAYFIVTELCNLDCAYCYIENGIPFTHRKRKMSDAVAAAAAAYFVFHAHRSRQPDYRPRATFYGGEPLLNFSAVKRITRVIRAYENRYHPANQSRLSIVTNGTLMTSPIARFLVRHRVGVSVSIDGIQCTHDRYRIYRGNASSTFRDAVRAYRLLKKEGGSPGVACTLTDEVIDSIDDVVGFFVRDLEVKEVGFSPALVAGSKNDAGVYASRFGSALLRAYEAARSAGVYEDRIGRLFTGDGFLKQRFTDCAGCGSQLVVAPDGTIGPCQAFVPSRRYFFGNICRRPSVKMDHAVLRLWRSRTSLSIAACMDCPAIAVCGGGCAQQAYLRSRSLFEPDERFCEFYRDILLPWYVRDKFTCMNKRFMMKLHTDGIVSVPQ